MKTLTKNHHNSSSLASPLPTPLVGVSTWALHRDMGAPPMWNVEMGYNVPIFAPPTGALSLSQIPTELARRGFDTLQICHFHLPTLDGAYLNDIRAAITQTNLSLHSLLVDEGDLTHPLHGMRDEAWIVGWLPIAARLGARTVRVIAGKTTDSDALKRSATALLRLARRAEAEGITLITENWFDLLSTPTAVSELLERTNGEVGFLLDWSNWDGPDKYQRLAQIAPLANSCHVQARFEANGDLDTTDFEQCLHLPYPLGFQGPFVLVNGGLSGIDSLRDAIHRGITKQG